MTCNINPPLRLRFRTGHISIIKFQLIEWSLTLLKVNQNFDGLCTIRFHNPLIVTPTKHTRGTRSLSKWNEEPGTVEDKIDKEGSFLKSVDPCMYMCSNNSSPGTNG